MNEAGNDIEAVSDYANTPIPMGTGIVVKANGNETVTFSTSAQTSTGNNGSLQMTLTQAVDSSDPSLRGGTTKQSRTIDNAIVSFNEGSELGKFIFNENRSKLYIQQGSEDYAIAYSDGQGEMPLNFKAAEDGEYTISFNPENVEQDYLHLIDNMTGADVDLLASNGGDARLCVSTYTFTAKTTDYESRFRLVFSLCEDANGDNETFAFFSNGNWIIANEGQATLQVVDVMGRVLSSQAISDNAEVNVNQPAGVYVLRLINGENVKVQKVVVR